MKKWCMGLGLTFALSLGWPVAHAQAPAIDPIDDDFDEENPCESDTWLCQGSNWTAVWISPDNDYCSDDPNNTGVDPLQSDLVCTLYEGEGYVLITNGQTTRGGSFFNSELREWNNFRLTAEVEMRDGTIARPADGMAVVIIGAEDPPGQGGTPAIGGLGGGMGSTFGTGIPHMIFEFDNWSGNTGDNNDPNHVGFFYDANGIAAGDAIPMTVGPVHIDQALWPLNNMQTHVAEPNRWFMEVLVQNGTVAYNLSSEDADFPKQRMFTYKIPGFQSFEGYMGVTGSTGCATQNHILHSISVQSLPEGFCLAPPAAAVRQITSSRSPEESSGDYLDGDELLVEIVLSSVREADENCDAAGATVITETIPDGWVVKDGSISDGGVYDAAEGTVTWNLTAAALTEGKTVSYTVIASVDANSPASVLFLGTLVEDVQFAEPSTVAGDSQVYQAADFDDCGALKAWNILGGYGQTGADNPGNDLMREDFMTDGDKTELDFLWFPGATIATDFGGEAASTSLISGAPAMGRNPSGVPEVFAYNDGDGGWVNLNDEVFGADPNQVMAYQQIYIVNTGDPVEVNLGASSDDSIQVILNEEEVWINSVPRGGVDDGCAPQDRSPDGINFIDPLLLESGANSLIVKTFEGGGGWNSTISFLDVSTGTPIVGGDVDGDGQQDLFLEKLPPGVCVAAPLSATRTIEANRTTRMQHQDVLAWQAGDAIAVTIAIADVRQDGAGCAKPATVTITETAPAGFAISGVTPDANVTDNVITWTLTGGAVSDQTLSYTATAGGARRNVTFTGNVFGEGDATTHAIAGDSVLANPSGFNNQGFINSWLLLGPYAQSTGFANPTRDAPGEARIRADWLTDGADISEEVDPVEGDTVNTDFAGASPATGIRQGLGACGLNPGDPAVPTWFAWNDQNDTIAYEDYYCGDINDIMMYAVTYVHSDSAVTWDIGAASDDSIQILVNDVEVWINNIPRGYGVAGEVQDVVPAVDLQEGVNKIMVKVFEGGGGHGFRLRFQDPITQEGITEGLTVCLDPANCPPASGPGEGASLRPGDVNYDGSVNISDPVSALNALFGGVALPQCYLNPDDSLNEAGLKVLDWNGDGGHNIADPVASLNNQFGGGPGHILGTACVVMPSPCGDVCQ